MFSVLVIEDDETINKMIGAKLKQENFKVFQAFDGKEALLVMDSEHIDLIICDVMMPNMDEGMVSAQKNNLRFLKNSTNVRNSIKIRKRTWFINCKKDYRSVRRQHSLCQ